MTVIKTILCIISLLLIASTSHAEYRMIRIISDDEYDSIPYNEFPQILLNTTFERLSVDEVGE